MEFNPSSSRAKKARLASRISDGYWRMIVLVLAAFGLGSLALLLTEESRPFGYVWLGLSVEALVVALWFKRDLCDLPPKTESTKLDDILEINLLAELSKVKELNPKTAWLAATKQRGGKFFTSHLLLGTEQVEPLLSTSAGDMNTAWQKAVELKTALGASELDAATLAGALLLCAPDAKKFLSANNLKEDEVVEVVAWYRRLQDFLHAKRPRFGGIGRDWASGFTPTLDNFGTNISKVIEAGGGHFHTLAHSDVLDSVIHNLSEASGGVALVGEAGTGKTGLAYALAQRLLEGRDQTLRYYQLVSLDASAIISASHEELEKIILTLFAEAQRAGNIILFLDEGQLFFGSGTGSLDISKILLPVLQGHSVKIVAAFTPNDYQKIKSSNESLAAQLGVINIKEPPKEVTLKILQDSALTLEAKNGILVTYSATREAYRLSGQYSQEIAYPGRAITLLEQSVPYAVGKILNDVSVQSAVEKIKGVKVTKAQGNEADTLLHLEDKIHARMINQSAAVNVVAAALRRGRAGVASPKRPIGSFLFLGPTGVGKTELARSLAATYFGDEKQMIRLDMSEYQQAEDVSRLLDAGANATSSLIMSIREQPFSVVLLDEVEKAHPNILNLLLQLLDEGQLTDQSGKTAQFRNAIIICTSNAGSADIIAQVGAGNNLENFERPLIEKLMAAGQFKPELVNRFDEIVLFRPLNPQELTQVAQLMIAEVNKTLADQNVVVKLTETALAEIVRRGYDPEFGARPMRRVVQQTVENAVASKILAGQAASGSEVVLDVGDLAAQTK